MCVCVCVYDSKFDVAQLNSVIYKLQVLYTYIHTYIYIYPIQLYLIKHIHKIVYFIFIVVDDEC